MYDEEPLTARRSQVSVKTIATVCFTALGIYILLYLVVHSRIAIGLTLVSVLLAIALHHGVDLLRRLGIGRGLAIFLVLLGTVAAVAGILLLLVPTAIGQGKALVLQLPDLIGKARHLRLYQQLNARFSLDQKLAELREHAPTYLQRAVAPALSILQGVVVTVAGTVTVLFLVIFMLIFGGQLVKRMLNETLPSRRIRYERMLGKIYGAVGGYLSGLGLLVLCNVTATTIFLAIIRMPFFLPLGILGGLSSLIPLVGNTIVGAVITLLVLAVVGPWKAVACVVFFLSYQQFESHFFGPLVYRRMVDLNPLIVLVAVLVFAELAGIPGAIVAVPAVATGQIILREVLLYRREQLQVPRRGPEHGPPPGGSPSRQLELEFPEPEGVADHRH